MADAPWRALQERWGAVWTEPAAAPADYGDAAAEYAGFAQGAALVDQSERAQLELSGPDASSFLHNLCTQDIRGLADGAGAEALLLNARGHVLFYVSVFRQGETLLLDADAQTAPQILGHLDRYLIRERVTLRDRTPELAAVLLAGPQAAAVVQASGLGEPPAAVGAHVPLPGCPDGAVRKLPLGEQEAYQVVVPRDALASWAERFYESGARPAGEIAWQAARIEAGWLEYGRDVTDKNLPQELARDARVLHFQKGCYLGQETVARLDALGHVNKLLVGLEWNSGELAPGDNLSHDGASVGVLTSAAFSPRTGGYVGLGYVRRGLETPGTQLASAGGPVVVRALPLV